MLYGTKWYYKRYQDPVWLVDMGLSLLMPVENLKALGQCEGNCNHELGIPKMTRSAATLEGSK